MRLASSLRHLLLAALLLTSLSIQPASAYTEPGQLRQYREACASSRAEKNVAIWDVWQMQSRGRGVPLELRGMVDGCMEIGGVQSFFLRVGVHRLPITVRGGGFSVSAGTAIYCLATVGDTHQFPPQLNLVSYVRNDDVVAWQAEMDRQAQQQASARGVGLAMRTAWVKDWASGDPQKQMQVAVNWIQSFNPSLDDASARTYARTIIDDAKANKVDPRLAMSLMAAESAYQSAAVSSVGAQGLGQLMPETASRLGVANAFDPVQNIHGSTRYLGQLMSMWASKDHPLSRVLASYNAGEGAVDKYNGVPPYAETQNYVAYVLSLYRGLGGQGV